MQLARQYKVLLIGDNCTDEWVYGECDRLSPEAPVPVLVRDGIDTAPGMAGNVKQNLESLGITVTFLCNKEESKKTRFIDSKTNQQIVRVDSQPAFVNFNIRNFSRPVTIVSPIPTNF